jgi:hypothetical protein
MARWQAATAKQSAEKPVGPRRAPPPKADDPKPP